MSHPEAVNAERERARQIIEFTDTHLFLTGKAGTGKTTFLRELQRDAPKRMVVLAPTGIAAINAGGTTIHSFFQLPFAPFIPEDNYKKMNFKLRKKKIQLIRSLDLVVIDEISMVRADLLDQIDAVLRQYRNRSLPFGGVQLLMIGDLQQLSPVAKEQDWELLRPYYDSPYFFCSHALQKTHYITIELQTVYRQSDPRFLRLLNSIRSHQANASVLEELNQRYISNFQPRAEDNYIRLVTHNRQAQQINETELAHIQEKTYTFRARIEGNFPEYSFPTEEVLTLKRGAQVMFVKNDMEKRYFNGTLGEVVGISDNQCVVRTADRHIEIQLEPEIWQNTHYALNENTREIEEVVEGTFRQYPVKLAWAITIHKSQGLTFEHAIIDAHSAFAHGQTYVALSRCKTLEGLVLSSPIPPSAIIQDQAIRLFNEQIEQQHITPDSIERLCRQHNLHLIDDLFDFSPVRHHLQAFIMLLEECFRLLYPQTLAQYSAFMPILNEKIIAIARKFQAQCHQAMEQDNVVDANIPAPLLKRIEGGAAYFREQLQPLVNLTDNTLLPTDNKEIKKRTASLFEQLQQSLHQKQHLLAHVAETGFHTADYQKQRTLVSAGLTASETKESKKAGKDNSPSARQREKLTVPAEIRHPELYNALHQWRTQRAAKEQVPAYLIMQNKALIGIANLQPRNAEMLKAVPYFGNKGLEKYGEEILEIVHAHLSEEQLAASETATLPSLFPHMPDQPEEPETGKTKRLSKEKSMHLTCDLLRKGHSVEEISALRQYSPSTIWKHLLESIEKGDLDIQEVVTPQKVEDIRRIITSEAWDPLLGLTELRNRLAPEYSFEEIRAVMAQMRRNGST